MSKAPKKYGIPYRTTCNKINNFHTKKHGGQTALSNKFEEVLVKNLDQLTNWKVPFDGYDIWCLVQSYFKSLGQHQSRFRDNMPGPNWVRGFIKHHTLTKCLTDNVKVTRVEVTREVLMDYFNNLEKWVNVSPNRIYNYDKTNVTDNPSIKTVICRCGHNKVEWKTNHSKTSICVIFCGNAANDFIPPMVVYKAEDCYKNWTTGGFNNYVYDCTLNGGFDSCTFETWFFKQTSSIHMPS